MTGPQEQEAREALRAWFCANLTYDNFQDWEDGQFADALLRDFPALAAPSPARQVDEGDGLRERIEALCERYEPSQGKAVPIYALRAALTENSPAAAALSPAPEPAPDPTPRCPRCGHAPHGGWCPNMASDNDCACDFQTLPPIPAEPAPETERGEAAIRQAERLDLTADELMHLAECDPWLEPCTRCGRLPAAARSSRQEPDTGEEP